jgi:threonine dehydrogenase-like Zn-dependent dehydrogenase
MTKTHYKAVISAPGEFHLEKVMTRPPSAQQVLVRLEGCGVCASNLELWEGRPWISYPLEAGAPGHEGWGIVEAVGGDVDEVREGDRVGVLSRHAFSEVELVDAGQVLPLPACLDGMDFPGESLAAAMNIFRRADIHPGQRVAVIGLGFLGSLLVQLATVAGASVIAISPAPASLDAARRMGALHAILLGKLHAVLDEVGRVTGGSFCERVIEATGDQRGLDLAGELSAVGGKLVIAGAHRGGARRVNVELWGARGLDVINAHANAPADCLDGMRAAIAMLGDGRLEPTPLYTHRFRLPDLSDAFGILGSRDETFIKALMTYD